MSRFARRCKSICSNSEFLSADPRIHTVAPKNNLSLGWKKIGQLMSVAFETFLECLFLMKICPFLWNIESQQPAWPTSLFLAGLRISTIPGLHVKRTVTMVSWGGRVLTVTAAAGFAANFAVGDRCTSKICTNHQAGSSVALEIYQSINSVLWNCGVFTYFHHLFSFFFSNTILTGSGTWTVKTAQVVGWHAVLQAGAGQSWAELQQGTFAMLLANCWPKMAKMCRSLVQNQPLASWIPLRRNPAGPTMVLHHRCGWFNSEEARFRRFFVLSRDDSNCWIFSQGLELGWTAWAYRGLSLKSQLVAIWSAKSGGLVWRQRHREVIATNPARSRPELRQELVESVENWSISWKSV